MNVTATRYGQRRFGGSKSASELPISISETVVEASNHCPVPTKSLMQALDASRSFLISPRCRAYDQGRWLNGKSTLSKAHTAKFRYIVVVFVYALFINPAGVVIADEKRAIPESVLCLNTQVNRGASLKSLEEWESVLLCRNNGLLDESMKAYWPSRSEQYRLYFPSKADHIEGITSNHIKAYLDILFRRFSIELSQTLDIVFVNNRDDVYNNGIERNLDTFEISEASAAFSHICTAGRVPAGFVLFGSIYICLPEEPGTFVESIPFTVLLFHEITHAVQNELGGRGRYFSSAPTQSGRATTLQSWFIEGTASALGLLMAYGTDDLPPAIVENARSNIDPSKLSTSPKSMKALRLMQFHGFYASLILASEHGFQSFFEVFSLVGEGASLEDSFQSVYGISSWDFNNNLMK